MVLLVFFAFLGGMVTILSPCILPILPIVLAGSITGGKKRPWGVVVGFIASFTFFTLFLSEIIRAMNISADALRSLSVIIIAGFGVSLLVPAFQVLTERLFSRLTGLASSRSPSATRSDFVSGFLVGVSLGLLWTPCVGPILASIITLAATSQVTTDAIVITLAYAVGTAVPLLAITYGGRNLLTKNPWLVANTVRIQKGFGVLMILTAIAIYFQIDRKFQVYILNQLPNYGVGLTTLEDNKAVKNALQKLQKPTQEKQSEIAPELILGGSWFNLAKDEQNLTIENLRGKVVLIDFWTYTCINCIRTLPYLKSWHNKYKDKGLVIIGVHTPEFEFEKNPDNVARAIKDFGLTYPVMQDNDFATWNAYNNHYWPAKYIIDKNGVIRDTHFGEGGYDETETKIQELLKVAGSLTEDLPVDNPTYRVQSRSPETYLGNWRIANFVSPEPIRQDASAIYSIPKNITRNTFAYGGSWTVGYEYARPSAGATLILRFDAAEVFLVIRQKTKGTVGTLRMLMNEKSVGEDTAGEDTKGGVVTVDADRLYKLIKLPAPGEHLLELEFLDGNLELYAFTFG